MNLTRQDSIKNSLTGIYEGYLHPEMQKQAMLEFAEYRVKADSSVTDIVPQYSVQNLFRPLFNKGPAQQPSIGDHPDFVHLKSTKLQEKCPIVTLFMDIESSTRLGILYEPEDVHRIKNAFICVAIELVKAFDGHVHRIMGDSVMAFFGGKTAKTENAITDSLNCASIIQFFVEQIILPKLEDEGYEDSFGIRIGIDYGPKEKVLWASYGYPSIEEVTATSFYVDVASKLQHSAGRNQIMLGQSLMQHIDFPDMFLDTKMYTQSGTFKPEYYLQPNHTDRGNNPINYIQKIFKWEDYLRYTPLGQSSPEKSGLSKTFDSDFLIIRADLHNQLYGNLIAPYGSCSRFVPKNHAIKFTISDIIPNSFPHYATFVVENHGKEATAKEDLGHQNTSQVIRTPFEANEIINWETTAYRGLHFLNVEIKTSAGLKYKSSYGVYID
jgi:adenylate cyclase